MSRKARNRVCFSPDMYDHNSTIFLKHNTGAKVAGNRRRVAGIWSFRLPRESELSSPTRLLRRVGAKVARALQFVSISGRSSRKVSSSANLTRSRSLVDPIDDYHRAEAIEDCIEFLNSSSSFHRSNSVSGNSC